MILSFLACVFLGFLVGDDGVGNCIQSNEVLGHEEQNLNIRINHLSFYATTTDGWLACLQVPWKIKATTRCPGRAKLGSFTTLHANRGMSLAAFASGDLQLTVNNLTGP